MAEESFSTPVQSIILVSLKPKDNLLVIFDELGGNIDTVQIKTVNRDTICSEVGEDMPASVFSWKRDDRDILSVVDDLQPKASLKCPKGKVITHVDFASFGDPYGVCGYFLQGNCTSPSSQKIVEQVTNVLHRLQNSAVNMRVRHIIEQLACGKTAGNGC